MTELEKAKEILSCPVASWAKIIMSYFELFNLISAIHFSRSCGRLKWNDFPFPDIVMKTPKPSVTSKSFQDLKTLLKKKAVSLPPCPAPLPVRRVEPEHEKRGRTFSGSHGREWIGFPGKTAWKEFWFSGRREKETPKEGGNQEDAEALSELTRLVKEGEGFRVEDTPEYIEGTSYDIPPEIAGRLHQGRYSIQAHLDLHGMNAQDAKTMVEKFLKWAVATGKRGVLIIHGRGLASPAEPVLKTRVMEWLTRGPWRKWIAAYASARLHDGGTGATYVLLRATSGHEKSKKSERER